ncbi:MAG: ATP-binding protein [Actinomycetota bacterium]
MVEDTPDPGSDDDPISSDLVEQRRATAEGRRNADHRPAAQLNMLHSLAAKLGSLNDVEEIGGAITTELGTIIDYHNCRIYLIQDDGRTLWPIVFRGQIGEYIDETFEELSSVVGEGITGRVAESGESLLVENALWIEWAVTIEGTDDIDESMLVVPMKIGERVVGVIVLSSLGVGLFDEDDQRLLEVLAAHAATAFENAKLLQREREAAETSTALLALSQALTRVHDVEAVLQTATERAAELLPGRPIFTYLRDPASGDYRLCAVRGFDIDAARAAGGSVDIDAESVDPLLLSVSEPFVISRERLEQLPERYRLGGGDPSDVLVAPVRFEPDGFAAIGIVAPTVDAGFSERDHRLAQGLADLTSLALGNARRFGELERFYELVEGTDAVFWEADPRTLRFTFLSGRASEVLGDLGEDPHWGDHAIEADRGQAIARIRGGTRDRRSVIAEYRVGEGERAIWIRDLVSVVTDPTGEVELVRGMMVDITERKRAEEALKVSERKYSEAFEREREAATRLRALDEMKNTFLEAVSHDLRTPLTSILGSAITLERTALDMPADDALDLVHRIATNARKLERLLGDLLDLDRLQRGIIAPQRRPTDVGALVRLAAEQTELLGGREVEIDATPVIASIDAAKVERIVENLLVNAARHTPPEAKLWVHVLAFGSGVEVVVEDDGPGVPEAQREAIFEPFRQLPGAADHSPGVGIGLSLVARFAELHGGRAWVDERPGGGAAFHVQLPGG